MFSQSHPEKKTNDYCAHCWTPVSEDKSFRFKDRIFCSAKCFRLHYRCLFHLFLTTQTQKFRVIIHRRKGWSAGLLAGSFFSLILTVLLGFILSNSFSGPPKLSPGQDVATDLPVEIKYPFFFNTPLPPVLDKAKEVPKKDITEFEDAIERQIKENVKIFLIKEYPSGPRKTVGISGSATTGSICALYLNDNLYEATTCIKDNFFFPRVALRPGKNIIEVLVHDQEGYVVPSNKVELFLDLNRKIMEKGRNITRGNLEEKNVCLTFDGGASASCAPEILAALRRYNIRCTFFLTGDFIRNHPNLIKTMVEDGHEIGNHTDTHPHFARLTSQMRFETLPWVNKAFVQNQIIRAEKAFFQVTGLSMAPLWRAPYGEHNLEILRWAEEIGYTHVSWTCGRVLEEGLDTLDWVHNHESPIYFSAKEIRDKIIHFGEGNPEGANGGIVLMHLATSRPLEDRVHLQLPAIIEGLQKRGYNLSTVGEVISSAEGSVYSEQAKDDEHVKNLWVSKGKDSKDKKRRAVSVSSKR
ncbi:MAG: polysaccharide deacetylase family protein [bacterium]